jgi:hypothetical protein
MYKLSVKNLVLFFLIVFLASLLASMSKNSVSYFIRSLWLPDKHSQVIKISGRASTVQYTFPVTSNLVVCKNKKILKDIFQDEDLGYYMKSLISGRLNRAILNLDDNFRCTLDQSFGEILDDQFFASLNGVKTINAKEFGAVCDGNTDDTEVFQYALDSIKDKGMGILFIPSGVCLINPLVVHSNTVIYGQGRSSVLKLLPQKLEPNEHRAILGLMV